MDWTAQENKHAPILLSLCSGSELSGKELMCFSVKPDLQQPSTILLGELFQLNNIVPKMRALNNAESSNLSKNI